MSSNINCAELNEKKQGTIPLLLYLSKRNISRNSIYEKTFGSFIAYGILIR